MTDVVAALIVKGNRFLICQRPKDKARALLWEFVGGKVEQGETKQQALKREIKEEIDVDVIVDNKPFAEVIHAYPDITINLTLFKAKIVDGIPKLIEHNDMKWITKNDIDRFTFCPADVDILKKIKDKFKGHNKRPKKFIGTIKI